MNQFRLLNQYLSILLILLTQIYYLRLINKHNQHFCLSHISHQRNLLNYPKLSKSSLITQRNNHLLRLLIIRINRSLINQINPIWHHSPRYYYFILPKNPRFRHSYQLISKFKRMLAQKVLITDSKCINYTSC
jgi:hypothetical protein